MESKKLIITFAKSTGFDPFFQNVKKDSVIEIPSKDFAGGGFGDVYHALSFDGEKSPLEQVVKIFKDERNEHGWRTIYELQDAIIEKRVQAEEMGRNFLDDHPCFIGFPQLIFEGMMDGKKVRGHITVNLISLGCTPLDKILPLGEDKTNDRINYLRRKAIDKMVMAYQFADCFNILHDIHYIHADITPDNVMVSMTEPLCVLIDYDSGVIVKKPDDNPITYGKLTSGWTPPEIQIESREKGFGRINITHHMDLWSIAAAIHNLIFGFPHLFLKYPTRPVYETYVSNHPNWPDINLDDSSIEFNTNRENYEFYRYKVFESLELNKRTINEFRTTFTKGIFHPEYRTEIDCWVYWLEREIGKDKLSRIKTPKWTEIRKLKVPVVAQPLQPVNSALQLYEDVMRDLTPEILRGEQKLQTHRSMIIKIANNAGLNGKEIAQNLEVLLDMYRGMASKKNKDEGFSNVDKSLLLLQAKLAHVDITSILNP